MEMRHIHTEEIDLDFLQLAEDIRSGDIFKKLHVGDQITAQHDKLGKVVFDVLDFDREELPRKQEHSITLQMHRLEVPDMPFDAGGCNKWESSSIRKYLNSEEFINGWEGEFKALLTEVYKTNDDREKTLDTFFILSTKEMTDDYMHYAYYNDRANMCKQGLDGFGDWYFTRSAYRGHRDGTWYVLSSGYVGTHNSYSAHCCAPACVISYPMLEEHQEEDPQILEGFDYGTFRDGRDLKYYRKLGSTTSLKYAAEKQVAKDIVISFDGIQKCPECRSEVMFDGNHLFCPFCGQRLNSKE